MKNTQDESANRQATIELRDKQLDSEKRNAECDQKIFKEQLANQGKEKQKIIDKMEQEQKELAEQNKKLEAAVQSAQKGTTALKKALAVAQETLRRIFENYSPLLVLNFKNFKNVDFIKRSLKGINVCQYILKKIVSSEMGICRH